MTTYYVDGAVGNDSNAGTSEGSGNAWATIDKAMNTVTASDVVYVKASATYSETPNIDTSGGTTSPILFEGYTTTTGDNGKVTISGSTNCLTSSQANGYYIFRNFIFTGASSHGVSLGTTNYCAFDNCEATSNGGDGWNITGQHTFIANCVASNNTGTGIVAGNNTIAIATIAGINGTHGYSSSGLWLIIYKCVAYGGGSGDNCFDLGSTQVIVACTADGENVADGYVSTTTVPHYFDCIAYDCVNGFEFGTPINARAHIYNPLVNSNTTDYSFTTELIGVRSATGAPAFTDEANDDYTLGSGSAAIDAGLTPGGIT